MTLKLQATKTFLGRCYWSIDQQSSLHLVSWRFLKIRRCTRESHGEKGRFITDPSDTSRDLNIDKCSFRYISYTHPPPYQEQLFVDGWRSAQSLVDFQTAFHWCQIFFWPPLQFYITTLCANSQPLMGWVGNKLILKWWLLVAKMANSPPPPNSLHSHMSVEMLSFRQVLIPVYILYPPSTLPGATFCGWLEVCTITGGFSNCFPLVSDLFLTTPAVLYHHPLRQLPTSFDPVAPFQDGGTLHAFLGPRYLELRELHFHIGFGKMPPTCCRPLIQRDSPAGLHHPMPHPAGSWSRDGPQPFVFLWLCWYLFLTDSFSFLNLDDLYLVSPTCWGYWSG